jgi:hypothetical protein
MPKALNRNISFILRGLNVKRILENPALKGFSSRKERDKEDFPSP